MAPDSSSPTPGPPPIVAHVHALRSARGWSQAELADRAGLSRAGISAIETGRLVPSTEAALALAAAFGVAVEDVFALRQPPASDAAPASWAWMPTRWPAAAWQARGPHGVRLIPAEPTAAGFVPHDDLVPSAADTPSIPLRSIADDTLVIAGCDPAAGLLVAEAARQEGLRILAIPRSSRAALTLLADGAVDAAGTHLGTSAAGDAAAADSDDDAPDLHGGNVAAVRTIVGPDHDLLHVAQWDEGLAIDPRRRIRSIPGVQRARLRWIGREAGSGARECLDAVLAGRTAPKRVARDHRGVVDAIAAGFADAGACLRLTAALGGLDFLSVRRGPYDLCLAPALRDDPRGAALRRVLRSDRYRRQLAALEGYDARDTGVISRVTRPPRSAPSPPSSSSAGTQADPSAARITRPLKG